MLIRERVRAAWALGALLLLHPVAGHAQATPTGSPDPLAALNFLLGTWKASTDAVGAAGATAIGSYSFQRDLAGHMLSRRSSQDTCTGPATFDCQHHDQLTLFVDPSSVGSGLSALYLDSEGHVIHYTVTVPAPQTAVFQSVAAPGAPAFRLTYHLQGTGEKAIMEGSFEGAAPGSAEYHPYLRWRGAHL